MRKFNTQLTRLLNIDVPLIQAPIAPFAGPALAAAVANAGGLGMLSVGWSDPDRIREAIREVRAHRSTVWREPGAGPATRCAVAGMF